MGIYQNKKNGKRLRLYCRRLWLLAMMLLDWGKGHLESTDYTQGEINIELAFSYFLRKDLF